MIVRLIDANPQWGDKILNLTLAFAAGFILAMLSFGG